MNRFLQNQFRLHEYGTNVKTEVTAGLTTFFSMSYIVLVTPTLISQGDPQVFQGVFVSTCLAAFIGTLLMALLTNLPLALAPSVGLSALFTYSILPAVVPLFPDLELDFISSYQVSLTIIFLSGVLFFFITLLGWREAVIDAIPHNIKLSISSALGILLCYLGVEKGELLGIVNHTTQNPDYLMTTNSFFTLFGLLFLAVLASLKIQGAVLISILVVSYFSFIYGNSQLPYSFLPDIQGQFQNFSQVSFLKLDFSTIFQYGNFFDTLITFLVLVVILSVVDIFDSTGTFIGVVSDVTKKGTLSQDRLTPATTRKAFLSDSIATIIGALLGTSTVTTYMESTTGIQEGGKTGLCSVTTGFMFLLLLFFAPFITFIPPCATAPALIYTGYTMIGSIRDIDFDDITEGLPAFLTIITLPLSQSVATGVGFGLVTYVLMKTFTGNRKSVKPFTWSITLFFCTKYLLSFLAP